MGLEPATAVRKVRDGSLASASVREAATPTAGTLLPTAQADYLQFGDERCDGLPEQNFGQPRRESAITDADIDFHPVIGGGARVVVMLAKGNDVDPANGHSHRDQLLAHKHQRLLGETDVQRWTSAIGHEAFEPKRDALVGLRRFGYLAQTACHIGR